MTEADIFVNRQPILVCCCPCGENFETVNQLMVHAATNFHLHLKPSFKFSNAFLSYLGECEDLYDVSSDQTKPESSNDSNEPSSSDSARALTNVFPPCAPGEPIKQRCSICKRVFSLLNKRIVTLVEHAACHLDHMPYGCMYCPVTYKQKSRAVAHGMQKHNDPDAIMWRLGGESEQECIGRMTELCYGVRLSL